MSTLVHTPVTQSRRVERLVAGQATSDGAGVKLTRVLTQDLQHRLDPASDAMDRGRDDTPGSDDQFHLSASPAVAAKRHGMAEG